MFAPPVAMAQTKPAASSTSELAPQRSTLVARPFGASAVEQARMLHRSIGNRATLRRPAQPAASGTGNEPHGHHGQPADQASLNAREATPGIAWDFSKNPVFPPDRVIQSSARPAVAATPLPRCIQRKLAVGGVNDPLEHEADRVADQVMRTAAADTASSAAPPRVSRKCACRENAAQVPRPMRAPTSEAGTSEAPGIGDAEK
jgi:hypothetical protein